MDPVENVDFTFGITDNYYNNNNNEILPNVVRSFEWLTKENEWLTKENECSTRQIDALKHTVEDLKENQRATQQQCEEQIECLTRQVEALKNTVVDLKRNQQATQQQCGELQAKIQELSINTPIIIRKPNQKEEENSNIWTPEEDSNERKNLQRIFTRSPSTSLSPVGSPARSS